MADFRIFLDLDGVLYNWSGAAAKRFKIDVNDPEKRKILKTEHDGVEIIVGQEVMEETVEQLGYQFWADLKLFSWSKDLYYELKKLGDVTILTSPGGWHEAGKGKSIALERDFGITRYILARSKDTVAMPNAILIDDKPKNIKKFRNAGGWSYLWPNQFCIEDGEPSEQEAIDDCIGYVKSIKNLLKKRNSDEVLASLYKGNKEMIDV